MLCHVDEMYAILSRYVNTKTITSKSDIFWIHVQHKFVAKKYIKLISQITTSLY